MDTRPSLSLMWIDRAARVLRYFPMLVLAFVVIAFGCAVNEFLTETADQLVSVNGVLSGDR